MENFPALLVICARNSPATGEFPAQRPVTRSFAVFFDLHLNERLCKQSWGWWFETPSLPLWRHSNVINVCWALKACNCPKVMHCDYKAPKILPYRMESVSTTCYVTLAVSYFGNPFLHINLIFHWHIHKVHWHIYKSFRPLWSSTAVALLTYNEEIVYMYLII